MSARQCLFMAALVLALAVLFGAFGAHALRGRLSPEAMAIYHTAVEYHFWHGLGLLGVAALMAHRPAPGRLSWVAGLMVAGLLLFCASLYLLALTGMAWLGVITPLGGLAWVAAWLLLAWLAWRT